MFLLQVTEKNDITYRAARRQMTLEQLIDQAAYTAYRLGAYVLLHWADDPALLAIVFC